MLNLNVQLGGVDTSLPKLASGNYPLRLAGVEQVESKKAAGNYNLKATFETTQPGESTKGDIINPGFKVFKYYPLQQSETEGAPDFRRDLCVLVDACLGTDKSNRPDLTGELLTSLIGREVLATVKVENDPQYGETNSIGFLKHIS